MGPPKKALDEKFILENCCPEPNSGCWIWTGGINRHGYGRVRRNYNTMNAHRASWIVYNGKIPDGLLVRHMCNNRICVNPEHLKLGTDADNNQDMMRAGRHVKASKQISDSEIEEIRSMYASGEYTQKQLGIIFHFPRTTIENYVSGVKK